MKSLRTNYCISPFLSRHSLTLILFAKQVRTLIALEMKGIFLAVFTELLLVCVKQAAKFQIVWVKRSLGHEGVIGFAKLIQHLQIYIAGL